MKEVTAIIRMHMVNKTKEALLKEGFAGFTCRKVMGRGKKKIDFSVFSDVISPEIIENRNIAEQVSEFHRLVSKRMIVLLVNDEDLSKVVNTIMEVNSTGNPGDGKIFVVNVLDAVRVRTGERGAEAI